MIQRIFRQAMVVVGKDLLLEWRGKSRIISVLLFGLTTLLLFSFAIGPNTQMLQRVAPGFLTLALLLSSTLALSESFRLEREERAIEGLLLIPVDPTALYYGKAVSNFVLLLVMGPVLVPVALVLYSASIDGPSLVKLGLLWALASGGLAAPGTMYAAMTSRLRGQDVLLPLLLFPLVVPVLVATTKGISLLMYGDPMEQFNSWMILLLMFNLVYWPLCGPLFPFLMDDGG